MEDQCEIEFGLETDVIRVQAGGDVPPAKDMMWVEV